MKYPQTIGDYQVVGFLASGRDCDILLARTSELRRFRHTVAIKWLRDPCAVDGPRARLFVEEALLASRFHHPHVAAVHDIGEDGGRLFIAMDYIRGWSLRAIAMATRRSPRALPLSVAMTILYQAAAGLHHVHETGAADGRAIVHGEVSPTNLLVSDQGFAAVLDFGAAATWLRGKRPTVSPGAAGYLSPEHVRGEPIDHRADIYALGVLLYELTCGTQLAGRHLLESDVRRAIVRPSKLRDGYPRILEDVLLTCLDRRADHRYQTAEELQIHLELVASRMGVGLSPIRLARALRHLFRHEGQLEHASRRAPSVASPLADSGKTSVMIDRTEVGPPPAPRRRRSTSPPANGLVPRYKLFENGFGWGRASSEGD